MLHPEDKNTDIQSRSLCIAASLCLLALLFSSLGPVRPVRRRSQASSLFKWVQESRRPKRGMLVMREPSSACLGKEPEK